MSITPDGPKGCGQGKPQGRIGQGARRQACSPRPHAPLVPRSRFHPTEDEVIGSGRGTYDLEPAVPEPMTS
jgi:hypothetical protein